MSAKSFGATLAATVTTPWPPHSMKGRPVGSSPDKTAKPSGTLLINSMLLPILPLASLTPTILGISAKRKNSVVAHADDGAAGNIIDNHRNRSGFGDGFEMLVNRLLAKVCCSKGTTDKV